jgi:peptidoglycan/xylan/chitin deacetylase (PgdA/CDA1 family)
MVDLRTRVFKTGLETLYYTGAHHVMAALWRSSGAIFNLHHIHPRADGDQQSRFNPNGPLSITDAFLDEVLEYLERKNFDLVSLQEAVGRIKAGDTSSRFAAFTIDDGYKDNFTYAWPVFKKHDCPFTVFVTTDIIEGKACLWWLILEQVIKDQDRVEIDLGEGLVLFDTSSLQKKKQGWENIYWPLRGSNEIKLRQTIGQLAERYKIDANALCRNLAMTWKQVRTLNKDELVTIGAHTVSHPSLMEISYKDVRFEMTESRARIARKIGEEPKFFCYPYGDETTAGQREFALAKELGFEAAVTTRKGMIYEEHRDHLFALPRISLNGSYQQIKYIDLYMSGAPFVLYNKFSKVNAA